MPEENKDGGSTEGKSTTVEIEGKSYTVDDVKNIIAQQGEATKASQTAAKALTAAARYNVDVDTYVQNSEASFALMQELIATGIIDETGKILKKETPKPAADPAANAGRVVPQIGKADTVAAEALTEFHAKFGSLEKEIERLREDNVGLMRLRLQDKLSEQYPDLDEEDIHKVMATAYKAGGKKPVAEVAKELSEAKKAWMDEQEVAWAKKHGLNLDEIKRRKEFIEAGPEGGAANLFSGKKFGFQPKKGAKDIVQPKDAMAEFMSKRMGDR
jgi:DNA-binding transcriptional MerR regulator